MRPLLLLLTTAILALPILARGDDATPTERGLSVSASVGWGVADGGVRLVRGTRKTVITDTDPAVGWRAEIAYRWKDDWSAVLDLQGFPFPYNDRSEFTNGHVVRNRLNLRYHQAMVGIDRHLVSTRGLDLALGLQFGCSFHGNDIVVRGERELPQDLTQVNPFTFVFQTIASPAVSARVRAALPVAGRLSLVPQLSYTLTPLRANLIDDPEDPEPGSDIGNALNPLVASVGLSYRF